MRALSLVCAAKSFLAPPRHLKRYDYIFGARVRIQPLTAESEKLTYRIDYVPTVWVSSDFFSFLGRPRPRVATGSYFFQLRRMYSRPYAFRQQVSHCPHGQPGWPQSLHFLLFAFGLPISSILRLAGIFGKSCSVLLHAVKEILLARDCVAPVNRFCFVAS